MPSNDVTVVIPTIPGREGNGGLLERALRSVELQTFTPRIVIAADAERRGAAWARNEGLRQVTTRYVAWLDDDDELLPRHVEKLRRAIRRSGADMVYSYPEFVGSRDPLATSVNGQLVLPLGVPFGFEQEWHLRHRGNFIPVTYMVKTDLVRRVGGFPEPGAPDAPPVQTAAGVSADCEDYLLLLRMLDVGAKFVHLPEVTWRYHVHGANTGGRNAARAAEDGTA